MEVYPTASGFSDRKSGGLTERSGRCGDTMVLIDASLLSVTETWSSSREAVRELRHQSSEVLIYGGVILNCD